MCRMNYSRVMGLTWIRPAAGLRRFSKCFCLCCSWTFRAKPEPRIPCNREKSAEKPYSVCEPYIKSGTRDVQHVISVLTHRRKSEKSYPDQTEGGSNQTPIPCDRILVPVADSCKCDLKNRNVFFLKMAFLVCEYMLEVIGSITGWDPVVSLRPVYRGMSTMSQFGVKWTTKGA